MRTHSRIARALTKRRPGETQDETPSERRRFRILLILEIFALALGVTATALAVYISLRQITLMETQNELIANQTEISMQQAEIVLAEQRIQERRRLPNFNAIVDLHDERDGQPQSESLRVIGNAEFMMADSNHLQSQSFIVLQNAQGEAALVPVRGYFNALAQQMNPQSLQYEWRGVNNAVKLRTLADALRGQRGIELLEVRTLARISYSDVLGNRHEQTVDSHRGRSDLNTEDFQVWIKEHLVDQVGFWIFESRPESLLSFMTENQIEFQSL